MDHEFCYRATESRDPRFDGVFFVAVVSTGIYCRPSCPALVLKVDDVHFYRTVAAARADGFLPCTRCMPDAVPGSAEWIRYVSARDKTENPARPRPTGVAPWNERTRWHAGTGLTTRGRHLPMAAASEDGRMAARKVARQMPQVPGGRSQLDDGAFA